MIEHSQIDDVVAFALRCGGGETGVAELRLRWPGVHFTYCFDDDLPDVAPVRSTPAFNLYLVDGRDHCLRITTNPEAATGFVVAEREAE